MAELPSLSLHYGDDSVNPADPVLLLAQIPPHVEDLLMATLLLPPLRLGQGPLFRGRKDMGQTLSAKYTVEQAVAAVHPADVAQAPLGIVLLQLGEEGLKVGASGIRRVQLHQGRLEDKDVGPGSHGESIAQNLPLWKYFLL